MLDDFRSVVLFRRDDASIVIASLVFCFTLVIALIVQFNTRYFDQFLDIQPSREDTEHVDKHLEIVQV